MRKFLRIQATRRDITITMIFVIVGFLLVTQLLGQSAMSHQLQAQSEQDLGELIHELNIETDELNAEIVDLRIKLVQYQGKAADERAILDEARKNLQDLKIAAGLQKVRGPGIKMTITDSDDVINTFDFLDIVQELRVAGAEAISVDDIRVIARTSFEERKGEIYVGSKKRIRSPYEIKAIGDPETLYQAINLAGGCKDKLSSLEGVYLEITKEENLTLSVRDRAIKNQYAKPVKD